MMQIFADIFYVFVNNMGKHWSVDIKESHIILRNVNVDINWENHTDIVSASLDILFDFELQYSSWNSTSTLVYHQI